MKKVPTVLFVLTMTASGFANVLRAPNVVEVASRLGYPVYIASILGVWKLLGVLAIGTASIHRMPRLREWAYAGFTFDACGAFASHLSAGDALPIALVPAAFFVLQLVSYLVGKQLAQRSASRRRRQFYEIPAREPEMQT